eukprot:TRINITY_DN11967_c0_g1_i5.p1 TRINITY_DN11967_c0_g1~~TRINITY_DN11967_c0_g1_i5.p1  ORF type:complete len:110 (+),score=4.85 TRINITY_DN11967_c0_g1_i5:451-780(+)
MLKGQPAFCAPTLESDTVPKQSLQGSVQDFFLTQDVFLRLARRLQISTHEPRRAHLSHEHEYRAIPSGLSTNEVSVRTCSVKISARTSSTQMLHMSTTCNCLYLFGDSA